MANGKSKLPPIEKLVIAAGAIGVVKLPPETAGNVFDTQVQIEMREVLKRYPRLDNQRTINLAMEQSGLMKQEPADSDLASIRVPTLLIWGDKGRTGSTGHRSEVGTNDQRLPHCDPPRRWPYRVVTEFAHN